jgi:hypothetical protein
VKVGKSTSFQEFLHLGEFGFVHKAKSPEQIEAIDSPKTDLVNQRVSVASKQKNTPFPIWYASQILCPNCDQFSSDSICSCGATIQHPNKGRQP